MGTEVLGTGMEVDALLLLFLTVHEIVTFEC